jgi:SAM-dependent methyltransferase
MARVKEWARRRFGERVEAYSHDFFSDPAPLEALLERSRVKETDAVLDVASGSGPLARAFASRCRRVTAIDLTPGMIARSHSFPSPGIHHLVGDGEALPFRDGSFDLVVCRYAFHHFPSPLTALWEMTRVSRDRVVLVDGVSSEDPEAGRLHNRIERRRDPSHVRLYPESELLELFRSVGLELLDRGEEKLEQDVEEWIARAGVEGDDAEELRGEMERALEGDRIGIGLVERGGRLWFTYRVLTLVGRRDRRRARPPSP